MLASAITSAVCLGSALQLTSSLRLARWSVCTAAQRSLCWARVTTPRTVPLGPALRLAFGELSGAGALAAAVKEGGGMSNVV